MRVTLIGAQGFVGSAFARLLRARRDVELIEVTRKNYLQCAGSRSDVVIEAACNSRKFLADQEPVREFDASVSHRLRTLIDFPAGLHLHISSVDVYNNLGSSKTTHEEMGIDLEATSRYGFHKVLAEQLVRHYSKRWLIVRLAGMVGPGLKKNPVFDILNGEPLRISPDSQYQFLSTDDAARIAWQLAESSSRNDVFNVCGVGLVSPRQIADWAGKELNTTLLPRDTAPRVVDINVDKVRRWLPVPRSEDAVRQFVQEFRSE
jgi:nucleoside-diphosphate-sugar epimerase